MDLEARISRTLLPTAPPHSTDAGLTHHAITRLLEGHGWQATPLQIGRALAVCRADDTVGTLIAVLDHLGVPFDLIDGTTDIDKTPTAPFIVTTGADQYFLVTAAHRDLGYRSAQPGEDDRWVGFPDEPHQILQVKTASNDAQRQDQAGLAQTWRELIPLFWPLSLLSLAVNILGLATPFFIMAIYNVALPAQSSAVLVGLAMGLATIYLAEIALRRVRAAAILDVASGLERHVGMAFLRKLIALPLGRFASSDAFRQQSRLRQFENLSQMAQGPVLQAALDLPFLSLFVATIFWLAPSIGWILVASAAVCIASLVVLSPFLNGLDSDATTAQDKHRRLIAQCATEQTMIRRRNAVSLWQGRLAATRDAAIRSSIRASGLRQTTAILQQGIVLVAGITAGFQAARLAIDGALQLGSLIALLVLIWRILAPLQTLASAAPNLRALLKTLKNIEGVLALEEETRRRVSAEPPAQLHGTLSFEQVTVRFPGAPGPALLGVSFRVSPGEMIGICGRTMSGKSVLAETLAGLHPLSGGRVLIGAHDTRFVPVNDLRDAIGFAGQRPTRSGLDIRERFALAHPCVDDADFRDLLEELGIEEAIMTPDGGFNHRLALDHLDDQVRQVLNIAFALGRPAPIYVFDQPTAGLKPELAARVRDTIQRRSAGAVRIMNSNTPSDLRLCDRFLLLERGRVIAQERGARGLVKIEAMLTSQEAAA